MSKRKTIWSVGLLGLLAWASTGVWAQDSSTPSDQTPSTGQQPAAAYGQDNAPVPVNDNPPLSGLDMPSLEAHTAPLSYLQPGATFSESADTNAAGEPGFGGSVSPITRGLGSLALRRLWSNYDLALDYVGGISYYGLSGQGLEILQQMDVNQRIAWKRGQLALRDSFSYLPEGNFGSAYGAQGSSGVASLGSTSFGAFFGGSSLGTFGIEPRITNVSLADVTESLTPKSTFTAAGGYAFSHFFGNNADLGVTFIGSSQVSFQTAYNRILTSHTQVALLYGYQAFDFTVENSAFHSHIIQLMYGHRITGRLDLLIAAGPQFTSISFCQLFIAGQCVGGTSKENRLGVAGQAHLRYKFPRTSMDLSYQRYETSGSGLFAGAQSDIATLNFTRPLSRVWTGFANLGYSRNSRLQSLSSAELATCNLPGQATPGLPTCPGVDANVYSYGFVGFGLHRQIGHDFHIFMSYQFNELAFDNSYCGVVSECNRISNRQVITFGLDWTPRPIRLD